MKVSDSLDNVPNENVVTQQVTDRQTDQPVTDQLLELLEWLFATKNDVTGDRGFPYKFPQHNIFNGFYSVVFNSFDVLRISSKRTAHICFAMNIHLAVYLHIIHLILLKISLGK